jgi:UTP--glucose-1-phosphate uridylyltransferase
MQKRVRKAVIPAAGLGTRFLPATKAQPKEMLPIVDKPTIQYIIEELVAAGIEEIIIITGRSKRSIEDHFDKSYELEHTLEEKGKESLLELARSVSNLAQIHYVRQKEPRGLGHAILMAKSFIGEEPFAVLLGDDIVVSQKPCIGQMVEVYDKYQATILGVQTVPKEDVNKYGIVKGEKLDDRIYSVSDMVEKPAVEEAPSNVAILGRYIITPRVFEFLETQGEGAGGEIQLTDALKRLSEVENMYAYDFLGKRYDVGNKQGFLQATVETALRRDDLKDDFLAYLKNVVADTNHYIKYD